jgi:hypothetical protein
MLLQGSPLAENVLMVQMNKIAQLSMPFERSLTVLLVVGLLVVLV